MVIQEMGPRRCYSFSRELWKRLYLYSLLLNWLYIILYCDNAALFITGSRPIATFQDQRFGYIYTCSGCCDTKSLSELVTNYGVLPTVSQAIQWLDDVVISSLMARLGEKVSLIGNGTCNLSHTLRLCFFNGICTAS